MIDWQDTFSSDPFLRISRVVESGGVLPVLKTEVVRGNLNPRWKPIQVTMQQLSNSDPYRPLLIECFDWNSSGELKLIGQTQQSLDDLIKRCVWACGCGTCVRQYYLMV